MNTIEHPPLFHVFADTATFDGTRELYYRYELQERHDYLMDTTQDWTNALYKELFTLQYLLSKVPQIGDDVTYIVSAGYRNEFCKNLLESFITADETFIAKYIDIDAIAEKVANDLQAVEVNGHVFYWFNRANV